MEKTMEPLQFHDVERFFQQYFPEDVATKLTETSKLGGVFFGDEHVAIFAELCGLSTDHPIVQKLRIPYIIFGKHYFMLDAVVDDHSSSSDVLYVTHILFATFYQIVSELMTSTTPEKAMACAQIMAKRIAENTMAVENELIFRATPDPIGKAEEYAMMVGRSNCTILFYEIMCFLNNMEPHPEIVEVLFDVVHYMQMGDDVGDWTDDFENNIWTPLLKECAKHLESTENVSRQDIECALFTTGVYENHLRNIILGMNGIEERLKQIPEVKSTGVVAWIDKKRKFAHQLLREAIGTKLTYLSNG